MNLQEIFSFVDFQLNKDQSGNTLSASERNTCLKFANQEYFRTCYGLPEQYQPGQPLPKMNADQTTYMMDALKNFVVWMGAPGSSKLFIQPTGLANLPTDYVHYSSVFYEPSAGKYIDVEVLTDQFNASRLNDPITGPTLKNPICHIYGQYIMFWPVNTSWVHFRYYRMPVTPYYATTIVNDQFVYDAANSIQFEWPESEHTQLANLVLKYASTNLRDNLGIEVAQNKITTGQ